MQTITKLSTNNSLYLTARTALNIPSPELTGDWNFYNYFLSEPHEYYVEQTENTPWSKKGVVEVSKVLEKHKVYLDNQQSKKIYAADHYRALADMFFDCCKTNLPLRSLFFDVDDYLNTEEQKQKLYKDYLIKLNNKEIDNWAANETNEFKKINGYTA